MNKRCKFILTLACVLLAACGLDSCGQIRPKPEVYTKTPKPEYEEGTYEHFIYNTKGYPNTMEIYLNEPLLKRANSNCNIYICLSQQRGRLYVDGQVAADWPVSTGVPGRDTPTGNYRIVEKKPQYASNTYGNIYNAKGKMVKYNAEMPRDEGLIPEGGKFRGSPMPNWMRLTWDGVGMHTGKVKAGQRLSHGCIRTPGYMASRLYDVTGVGTKVSVQNPIEPFFPATAAMALADTEAEATREKSIEEANAARLRQWETDYPDAARRYKQRQERARARAEQAAQAQH